MCGRYYVDTDDDSIQAVLAAAGEGAKTGEVFPRDHAAVVTAGGEAKVMQWGFPSWDGKSRLINARSETAAEKPTFRRAFADGRCLIPASWYFEWETEGKTKIKHALSLPVPEPMYMAGLSRMEADGTYTYVILTRDAWAGIQYIHHRMPVILPRGSHDAWLHGNGQQAMTAAISQVIVDARNGR